MNGYEAFVLDNGSRELLNVLAPPKFPTWIGHHITHRFPAVRMFNVPYGEQTTGDFEVVGYAVERGLEAWVIAVRGNIIRPDGGTYHLTWSLDRELGKRPYHSNALIRNEGFTAVEPIRLYAAFDFVSQ